MSQPYVGEIRIFGGSFAPVGWALCHGQLLPISEYETLFTLIGTTYGGDGQSTFALPSLQSRAPLHQGTRTGTARTFVLGQAGGVESVTLATTQIPPHSHAFAFADVLGNENTPNNNLPARSATAKPYINDDPDSSMKSDELTNAGGSQPHENMQPFLVLNFIIALFGIYPAQN